jgi:biopolymer transport protein ExbB/TolQ
MRIKDWIVICILYLVVLVLCGTVTYKFGLVHGALEEQVLIEKQNTLVAFKTLEKSTQNQAKITKEVDKRTKRSTKIESNYDSTAATIDGLRKQLQDQIDRSTEDGSTRTDSCTAHDQLLGTMGGIIEEMATEGARIAREADKHANDSLMYQNILKGQ